MDNAVVAFRINVLKGQVFQLLLDGINTEAVRQGRIDIQRFPGNGLTACFRLETQGAHVMQTVRQLDQNDTDIPGHRQDHLTEGFSLGFLTIRKIQLVQFGDAVYKIRHFIAELLADGIKGDTFAVLDSIMQETRGDGGGINHQIRKDRSDKGRMGEIRLTGFAELAFMGLFGKLPGFFHQLVAVTGMVFLYPVKHLIQRHCFIRCESHG